MSTATQNPPANCRHAGFAKPVPRRATPKRMERLYERYHPFLQYYDPPAVNPAQWKMLTPGQMVDFFVKHNGDSRGSFYREVYPRLHKYQYGYNPRETDGKPSNVLNPIPRWVLFAFIQELKLS